MYSNAMGNTASSTDKAQPNLYGSGPDTMFTIKHAELGTCLQPVGSDPNPSASGTKLQLTSDCSQTAVNRFRRLANGGIMHSSGWCVTPSGSDLQLYGGDCSSSPWIFRGGDDPQQLPGAITDKAGKLCWASGDTADKQNNVTLINSADCTDGWITAGVDCTSFTNQIPGFRYPPASGSSSRAGTASGDDWSWNIGYDSSGTHGAPLDPSYDSFTEDDIINAFGMQGIWSASGSSRNTSNQLASLSPQSQNKQNTRVSKKLARRQGLSQPSATPGDSQSDDTLFKVKLPIRPECGTSFR